MVPAADLTLRSFFGVTLHTRTEESAKPPAIRLESSVKSTAVRPCRGRQRYSFSTMSMTNTHVSLFDTQQVLPGRR